MSDERKTDIPREEPGGVREPGQGASGAPPEGSGGKKRHPALYVAAILPVVVVAGVAAFHKVPAFHALVHPHPADNGARTVKVAKQDRYTCGMHPFIISDKPGNCPICGMKLTRVEDASSAAPGAPSGSGAGDAAARGSTPPAGRKILFYRNPMNPNVTSPVPAKDEMGMDYVPVYEDEVSGGGPGKAPEGYAPVAVGAESLRLAGVQTAPAVREKVSRQVRAVGNVVPDETRVRRVQTKIEGWVEKLHTNFVGQVVKKGQPLLEIYSPDLVASQQEYLLALSGSERMKGSPYQDAREMSSELVRAARARLELFDVPQRFIAELERTGKVRRTVTLNAPMSGYVTAKEVFEGMRIMPGMELFTVTDLSRVWIEADLYEYEAQAVRLGQTAILSPAYDPGARLKGRVAYINPTLSPESRTLKVRFEFPNPGLRLKPQMYADVTLDMGSTTGVVIPDSALIETGVRRIVFVDTGGGSLEPREVQVGVRGEGKAQILSGVREGERVAVKANFLLDSESKLRAALTKMTGGAPSRPQPQGSSQPPSQGHAGHGGGP